MSGYLRFYFAGLVLVGTLAATPAVPDPFADLFNGAPREPAATSLAQTQCLPRHGNTTADETHWVYQFDGHRKCWFLAEGIAKVKKTVLPRGAEDRTASLDENGSTRPRQTAVVDARTELLRSAPAQPSQPPAAEIKLADAASVLDMGTVTSAVPTHLHSRRLTPEHSMPGQVDVEQLLAPALSGSPPQVCC
ncbi:hypothetical protein [Bradyrhizobium sp. 149]|uniref:hypothetical protein n=1 Tax=Bradyrhizobium sp. 149 TaxID=2782624 RepID=UPI001FFBF399|nr:hypothetical protein [Bradyrhizobium sp. 149]